MTRTGLDDHVVVLDEAGVPTGEVIPVGEALSTGAWHGALVVWGVRDSGEVLFSRLPRDHAFEPSRLGPTATVHAGLGTPADAVREAALNRLGAQRMGEPRYIGAFRSERRYSGPSGDTLVRQHQDVYLVRIEDPLEGLSPDPGLVDTVYELPISAALMLLDGGGYAPAPGFDSMGRVSNALLVAQDLPVQGTAEMLQQLRAVAAHLDGELPTAVTE